MTVHTGNKGYLAIKKETTKGTIAAVPNVYVPFYDEKIFTNTNIDEDMPVMGHIFARYKSLLGMRSHGGDITIKAEPNTAGYFLDMILAKGTTTGAGPYTHPFTLSTSADPKAYTWDIQKGQVVCRFLGSELSELGVDFDKNKMVFKLKMSALKSFIVREIASVSGSGPYTITLKTNYDPAPSDGLIIGDTMRLVKSDDSTIDFVVDSIPDGVSITCSEDVSSLSAGDLIFIKAATPSYTLKADFMWALSQFRFSDTASNALSATQTRMEQGSRWTLMNKFEADEGAQRSGSFDPAALVRTVGDMEIALKAAFDLPREINRYLTSSSRALVIRHFSEDQAYELRITINNFKYKENAPIVKAGDPVYSEATVIPDYNTSDGQSFDVKVLNNVSSF